MFISAIKQKEWQLVPNKQTNMAKSVCCPVQWVHSNTDLELVDVFVDVLQVSHHNTLVLHHVIQHGQPIGELRPRLVELSQRRRFRLGTSRQTFIWDTHTQDAWTIIQCPVVSCRVATCVFPLSESLCQNVIIYPDFLCYLHTNTNKNKFLLAFLATNRAAILSLCCCTSSRITIQSSRSLVYFTCRHKTRKRRKLESVLTNLRQTNLRREKLRKDFSGRLRLGVFDLQKMRCSLTHINEAHNWNISSRNSGEMKGRSVKFILFPRSARRLCIFQTKMSFSSSPRVIAKTTWKKNNTGFDKGSRRCLSARK